jgi:glycosyltransferase involved in cell wall biosynthesis
MPRIGINPSRTKISNYKPARVTVAVLVHVPHQSGYFNTRFDVVKLCIESLIAHTAPEHDLLVFDNGSCPEVVEYLQSLSAEDKIQYLFLSSQNIGKIGALQFIFRAAPGEVVAYTDDDIFFLPGWLEAHLEILDNYPKVGMVSGIYIKPQMHWSVDSTLALSAHPGVEVTQGCLIPREWEEDYINNMGRTWESYAEEIKGLEEKDVVFKFNGVEAFASAGHHQFVAYRQTILQVLPDQWSGRLMGKMRELDEAVDKLGCVRLCTHQKTTHLMGNMISNGLAAEAQRLGLSTRSGEQKKVSFGIFRKVLRLPLVHRFIQFLYDLLYWLLNA